MHFILIYIYNMYIITMILPYIQQKMVQMLIKDNLINVRMPLNVINIWFKDY